MRKIASRAMPPFPPPPLTSPHHAGIRFPPHGGQNTQFIAAIQCSVIQVEWQDPFSTLKRHRHAKLQARQERKAAKGGREIEIRRSNKNYELLLRRRRRAGDFRTFTIPLLPSFLTLLCLSLSVMSHDHKNGRILSPADNIPLFLSFLSPQFLWRPDASANFNCFTAAAAVCFYELCFCHSGVKVKRSQITQHNREGRGTLERREVCNYGT